MSFSFFQVDVCWSPAGLLIELLLVIGVIRFALDLKKGRSAGPFYWAIAVMPMAVAVAGMVYQLRMMVTHFGRPLDELPTAINSVSSLGICGLGVAILLLLMGTVTYRLYGK